MNALGGFADWWKPLHAALELITLLAVCPAWFFILYSVCNGQAKSPSALAAFFVFACGTLLHIAFDGRNRRIRRREENGFDFDGGGE